MIKYFQAFVNNFSILCPKPQRSNTCSNLFSLLKNSAGNKTIIETQEGLISRLNSVSDILHSSLNNLVVFEVLQCTTASTFC